VTPPGFLPSPAWLERANRLSLLAGLLASTIHDVNNALQVIGGGVELLQMKPGDADAVTRAIATQSERATRLLAELARFSRDAGGVVEPVNLRELCERALALRHFSLTRLRVTRGVDGEDATVAANRRDLLQILLNLIINAERALPGTSAATLRLVIGRAGDMVLVSVEDNGPGVPPGDRATLFDPRAVPGAGPVDHLGIGLAVSRALAERQGGALTYTPRDGAGAVFRIALPASGR
jgi:C4-dicarboxylate-specific signal transduction histidine kinase